MESSYLNFYKKVYNNNNNNSKVFQDVKTIFEAFLRALVKNTVKENFYGKRKKKKCFKSFFHFP